MNIDKEFERAVRAEFKEILPNTIFQNENGGYTVFGKYCIEPDRPGYRVFCHATEVGIFNTTKTALSWCIADKYQAYNTARDILELDIKLGAMTRDIAARTAIAENSKQWEFRDIVGTKLETKIIRKKKVENELTKCVNWAKYIQQRGFNNETARTGRNQPNKASR
jgi:hypothetical protein